MKLDALWSLVRMIPKGKVSTYGILAKRLGTSPRAVGQALKKNTKLIIVPCHRVIKSNGELGGYVNGAKEKKRLLESEGVDTNNLLAFIDDMNI